MHRYLTTTFAKFFFGFLIIIGIAFGVLIAASSQQTPRPVDNVALPQ